MPNFFLTVGQKYRSHVTHPLGLSPDGYARIVAPDESCARRAAVDVCGTQWAFVYTANTMPFHLHPLGEQTVIEYAPEQEELPL
jgi:hypothetical protein